MKKFLVCGAALSACAFVGTAAMADGTLFSIVADSGDDPLTLFSQNSNDGYSAFRGIVFRADEDLAINGAFLWTKSTNGLNATFELYTITNTLGDVLNGATLERTANHLLQGDLGFHGGKFDTFNLVAGNNYLIRVGYTESADENWFTLFDQSDEPPLDLGPVTVIDGTLGGNTSNFVAPGMALQIVPGPGALALLGLAGLAGRRRRRA